MLIDSHCHIDAAEFDGDREQVVAEARALGVGAILVPAVTVDTFNTVKAAASAHPKWIYPAYGLHPVYIATHRREHLAILRQWLESEPAVAVGEIGLDGFVDGLSMVEQEWFFAEQLKLAREFDLPVILHIRRAVDLVLKHLRRSGVRGGIAHAFNGSPQQARLLIDLGFKLGFGGAMTYSRALNIRRLAADLPLEAIVLETDAPDIPPSWDAQGRNRPGYLLRIAETLAALRADSVEHVVAQTGRNVRAVVHLG